MSYASIPKVGESWRCSICHGEDPTDLGGTVAHTAGDLHADHRDCILRWYEKNASCPSCRFPATTEKIIPIQRQVFIFLFREGPKLLSKCKTWALFPANQAFLGLALGTLGHFSKKRPLIIAGCLLQFIGLHRALEGGNDRSRTSYKVWELTREVLMRKNRKRNLETLSSLILEYPSHFPKLVDGNEENILSLYKAASDDLKGDLFVKAWKVSAAVAALYNFSRMLLTRGVKG